MILLYCFMAFPPFRQYILPYSCYYARIELTDDLSYIYEDIARVNKKAAEESPRRTPCTPQVHKDSNRFLSGFHHTLSSFQDHLL